LENDYRLEAQAIFDFYLESAVKKFGTKTAEAKKNISEKVIPLLAKINNEIIKAHYIKKLANILKVNEEAVIQEIERNNRLRKISFLKPFSLTKKAKLPTKTRRERLEEFILSLVLQKTDKTASLINQIEVDYLINPTIKKIVLALKKFISKHKFKVNDFVVNLPEELRETFDRLYLQDIQDILDDEKEFNSQFKKAKLAIERLYLKNSLSQIIIKVREAEKNNKQEKVSHWQKKFANLSKRLQDLS